MNNNNIFGLNTPTNNNYTNPFSNTPSVLDTSLAESYAKLEALKRQQQMAPPQPVSTVFTDIDSELKNLSEDETNFITSSKEYQTCLAKYQNEFSQFLINKFSNEYLQTGNTRTLEEMLYVIRSQKTNIRRNLQQILMKFACRTRTFLIKTTNLLKVI
jgi:hypothetical protein